jgi:hypothetical protein
MVDTTKKQAEQTQTTETPGTEIPGTETPTPGEKSDRDEIKEASQQLFRTLFRAGVHLAMIPVYMLPEEPREHFVGAGREFTRGVAALAREFADDVEKVVDEVKENMEKIVDDVKEDMKKD